MLVVVVYRVSNDDDVDEVTFCAAISGTNRRRLNRPH